MKYVRNGLLLIVCAFAASMAPQAAYGETDSFSGTASWFGERFHGKRTASGERFDMHAMTAAHRELPFGTVLRVTNKNNHRTVVVRVNDRGPYRKRRIIDLSYAAAGRLGMRVSGTAPVMVEVVGSPDGRPLKEGQAFFIRLDDAKHVETPSVHAARLTRAGLADAPARLTAVDRAAVIGPYPDFESAERDFVKIDDAYPRSIIMLTERDKAQPRPEMAAGSVMSAIKTSPD